MKSSTALFLLQVRANMDVEDCVRQQVDDWHNAPTHEYCEEDAHDRAEDDVNDWIDGSCAQRSYRPKDDRKHECTSDSSSEFDFDKEMSRLKNSIFSDSSCSESEKDCRSPRKKKSKTREPCAQSICLKPRVDEICSPVGCDIPIPVAIGEPGNCFDMPLPVAIGEPGNCFDIPLPVAIGTPGGCFDMPLPVEIGKPGNCFDIPLPKTIGGNNCGTESLCISDYFDTSDLDICQKFDCEVPKCEIPKIKCTIPKCETPKFECKIPKFEKPKCKEP